MGTPAWAAGSAFGTDAFGTDAGCAVNGLALLGICFFVETMAMMKNDIQYRGCKLQMFTSCISVISS